MAAAAAAPETEAAVQQQAAALESLQARLAAAQREDKPPPAGDASIARLIDRLTPAPLIAPERRYTTAQIGELLDICQRPQKINGAYLMFDAAKEIDPAASPAESAAGVVRVMERNALRFQDQIAPLLSFTVRCQALLVPLVEAFYDGLEPAARTAVRKQGVLQARNGVVQLMVGTITQAADRRFSATNRTRLIDAVADAAASLARILSIAQREQVLSVLSDALPALDADHAARLRRVAQAMADRECRTLCALQMPP